jgi:hypothetical protein
MKWVGDDLSHPSQPGNRKEIAYELRGEIVSMR